MLAIVGGKGGCGKTTTSLGMARAFADRGRRTLVVDADCDTPNLHTMAETPPRPGLGALDAGRSRAAVCHESQRFTGVEVLPAGRAIGAVPPETLRRIRDYPGRVLLDCPAGASSAVTAPVRAADAAIVVSTGERHSQRDARKTARVVEQLDTDLLGAVLTRVDDAARAEGGPVARECPILGTVPPVDGPVLENRVGRAAYASLAKSAAKRNV